MTNTPEAEEGGKFSVYEGMGDGDGSTLEGMYGKGSGEGGGRHTLEKQMDHWGQYVVFFYVALQIRFRYSYYCVISRAVELQGEELRC